MFKTQEISSESISPLELKKQIAFAMKMVESEQIGKEEKTEKIKQNDEKPFGNNEENIFFQESELKIHEEEEPNQDFYFDKEKSPKFKAEHD